MIQLSQKTAAIEDQPNCWPKKNKANSGLARIRTGRRLLRISSMA